MNTEVREKKARTPRPAKNQTGAIVVAPMTIDQFRSYLKGIMFVGGQSWCPDRTQWEAIVEIIDKLIVNEPTQVQSNQPTVLPSYLPPQAPQYYSGPSLDSTLPVSNIQQDDGTYQTPFV